MEALEDFPKTITRACCPYKPGCGNTTIYLYAKHDLVTDSKVFGYRRQSNGDFYYKGSTLHGLRKFLEAEEYAAWPEA